eukprot:TRINITY_DN30228_c0_g1_i2.p2 TRINITY_DN30228_c0_g1~~TRINITY_DN30228_c0_g1_i2.p2  ORF type:complete len:129 (+),score=22.89 TRINITY_DN30228_c0_g1_i2:76-462(+)
MRPSAAAWLAALLVLALPAAGRLSDHWRVIRMRCPKSQCNNPDFPILDWNHTERRCLCRRHPCHNVKGKKHVCDDPRFPYLAYNYDQDREIKCVCKKNPCTEEKCEPGSKVAWDHNGRCMCLKPTSEL